MRKLIIPIFLGFFIGLGCQNKRSGTKIVPETVSAPQDGVTSALIEDPNGLVPALYYVPVIDVKALECGTESVQSVKNSRGESLARVCEQDYKSCLKQGTCLLSQANGLRLINFTTRREKIPQFTEKLKQECPYGLGASDICLDPYYTVAADLSFHKLGDVIYIPSVAGLKLPSGDTHDGYFIVRDSSPHLKSQKRFDFFTGFDKDSDVSNQFKRLGLGETDNRFKFEIVAEDKAAEVRRQRNYPKLNHAQQVAARGAVLKVIKSKN